MPRTHHIIGPNSDLGPGWVEFSFQYSTKYNVHDMYSTPGFTVYISGNVLIFRNRHGKVGELKETFIIYIIYICNAVDSKTTRLELGPSSDPGPGPPHCASPPEQEPPGGPHDVLLSTEYAHWNDEIYVCSWDSLTTGEVCRSSYSEGPGQEVRYNTNTACPSDGMGHHAQLCKRNQKGWNVVFVFSRKVVLRKNKPVMHYATYLVFSLCLPNHHNHNLARVLVTWKCSVNANKQRNAMQ